MLQWVLVVRFSNIYFITRTFYEIVSLIITTNVVYSFINLPQYFFRVSTRSPIERKGKCKYSQWTFKRLKFNLISILVLHNDFIVRLLTGICLNVAQTYISRSQYKYFHSIHNRIKMDWIYWASLHHQDNKHSWIWIGSSLFLHCIIGCEFKFRSEVNGVGCRNNNKVSNIFIYIGKVI